MKTKLHYFVCFILIFTSVQAFAQRITVTGRVLDEVGQPLPGANVLEKGTTNGTVTDMDGRFSVKASPGSTLIFSFVGLQRKEVKIPVGKTNLGDIKLTEEAALQEVVVVGHTVARQKSSVGSTVMSVSRDVIKAKESVRMSQTGSARANAKSKSKAKTWKRSNGEVNRVRLQVGDKETLPLKGRKISVKIDGFRARVLMDCFFYNDHDRRFEGSFKLRLPNGASPYFFAFGETKKELNKVVNPQKVALLSENSTEGWSFHPDSILAHRKKKWSRVKQARVVPKQKAANAYTKTVARGVDPALMEWSGADVFNCRVYPLMPKKMHHIVIGYDLNLLEVNGQRVLELALGNAKEKAPLRVELLAKGVNASELEVSPKTRSKIIKESIYFDWQQLRRDAIKITLNEKSPVLLRSSGNAPINYFATAFKTNLPKVPRTDLKENAVFLLDVSLSSQPDKFNVWLQTLAAVLQNNQDVIKKFSVMCFNVEAFWWKEGMVKNTNRNIRRFLRFANRLSLEGATDLGAALEELNRANWLKNASKYLFLLSDGDITWGEDNLYGLSKRIAPNDELYAFSTGFSGTNPRILDHLTRSTKGAVFSIVNEDEIQEVSKNFRFAPWRIDNIEMKGAHDFILAGRPQYLYAGQKLILAGRCEQLQKPKLEIQVSQKGKKRNFSLSFDQQIASELTKRVYGQIATTQLEVLGHLAEKEAIQYAVHYRVPGQTCSFVMLESESDYRRFKIDKTDNTKFIAGNTIKDLLQKLLAKNNLAQLGNAKLEFLHFIKKLEKGESGVKLKFTPQLQALIEGLSTEVFEVKSPKLNIKRRTIRRMPKELLADLQNGKPSYTMVNKWAEVRKRRNKDEAIRLLSSLVEKSPGNMNQLRDIGFSAMKWNMPQHTYFIFKKLIDLRPYQPPSYQLIAQALEQLGKRELAILYYEVILQAKWSGWEHKDFRLISALDYLRFLRKLTASSLNFSLKEYAKNRIGTLESWIKKEKYSGDQKDLLVYITWNTDDTYVDLFVKEPSKEVCSYHNDETKKGGVMTEDVEGLGPVVYYANKSQRGKYTVRVNYYNEEWERASTRTRVYIVIYRNWGKENEQVIRKVITLDKKDANNNEKVEKMQQIAKLRF